ncbi:MAG TPA: VOC family protein, partial [Fontimonas sp.]
MATQRLKKKSKPKKAAAKKSAAKKATVKKPVAKKSAAKKPAAKKPAPRKAAATRKAATKKPPARKPAARAAKPKKTADGGPLNWPSLSPYMTVRNGQASLDFYREAFGFHSENEPMRDERGEITHAGMRLGEACIMFAPQGMGSEMRPPRDSGGIGLSLYVYVADVDRHYAQ